MERVQNKPRAVSLSTGSEIAMLKTHSKSLFALLSSHIMLLIVLLIVMLPTFSVQAQTPAPILLAISAEYGIKGSHTAQSIEKGVRVAIEEINAAGGLLGGRQLKIIQRDDRGLPARAVDNMRELAKDPQVVGVFCGRFSPVALELVPVANQEKILLLNPWAAADGIANNGHTPNYVFRLSMTDSWAMEAMLKHAQTQKMQRLAVILPNTSWGRSNQAALEVYLKNHPNIKPDIYWYNWGDTDFNETLTRALDKKMQGIIMVANEAEGVHIVKAMTRLPAKQRVPIIAHWGIAGGEFASSIKNELDQIDLVVAQTYTLVSAKGPRAAQVNKQYQRIYGEPLEHILAQVGFAHAYDLTHLLALAIQQAGSSDRTAVRNALERLPAYTGLVRHYKRAFTPKNHEALDSSQVFMARFLANGTLTHLK
jgi:branched-chain amino acid transport system substrate-binding protein